MTNVTFSVREAQPEDFNALWEIDQQCFPPGISYSRVELRVYMRRRGAFTLVAASDGTPGAEKPTTVSQKNSDRAAAGIPLGGFIVAEAGRKLAGHIVTIDVVAAAQRCGLGSLLLRAAEDRLAAAGCRRVELETAVDNPTALLFYKRHGYSVEKTVPRYYSNGVDALVLAKTLA